MPKDTSPPEKGKLADWSPRLFRVPFHDTHLWLVLDAQGVRWSPVSHLACLMALPIGDVLTRLDGNPAEFRHACLDIPAMEVGGATVCLRMEYLHHFLQSIKEKRVPATHLGMLHRLRADACEVLNSFRTEEVIEGAIVTITSAGEPRTSTLAIAQGTDVQHKNVIEMVRAYLPDMEEFGRVAFETQPFSTPGGTQSREVALLNEPQATLLMTYMRNSEIVRKFKMRLVKAFYQMRSLTQGEARIEVIQGHDAQLRDIRSELASLQKFNEAVVATFNQINRKEKSCLKKRIPGAEMARWEKWYGPYTASWMAHKTNPDFYPKPKGNPPQEVLMTGLGAEEH